MPVADIAVSDVLIKDRTYLDGRRAHDSRQDEIDSRLLNSKKVVEKRRRNMPVLRFSQDLPIYEHLERIRELLASHQVIIVAGETGSGKTTQLPIACLAAGLGVVGAIAHTQPRRLAARAVSQRIAEQLNVELGQEVGYAVRFEEKVSDQSLIKVMTDGLLLAEINKDRQLRNYEVVIVDEAHERSLNIDFLLGYLHRLVKKRKELKVIVTSATIDVEGFASYFGDAPVVKVDGRSYPVDVVYRPPEAETETAVYQSIDEILEMERHGPQDALMFLPTEQDILLWSNRIKRRYGDQLEVLPLYARLPPRDQQRIFQPSGKRRILLSTNVAETSLTVPNIRYVIDTGTARISRYSPRSRIQRLPVEQISQASANQRLGRCGRIAPGKCFRIYSESVFELAQPYTEPELRRTNLASVVLQIKYFRLGEIRSFPFIDPPNERSIQDAERLLDELGAIQGDKLTAIGKQMARLPIEPRHARMLIEASRRNALREVLIIVSALSIQDPRLRPGNAREAADAAQAKFQHERSDFMTFVRLWHWAEELRKQTNSTAFKQALEQHFISVARYFEWRSMHRQLHGYCQRLKLRQNSKQGQYRDIHLAILTGSIGLIGIKDDQRNYAGVYDNRFQLIPGSRVTKSAPKWVVAGEIVETQRVYARTVAAIERKWVEAVAARHLKISYYDPYWDERRGEAMILARASLFGLPIYKRRSQRLAPMRPEQAQELFVLNALVTPKQSQRWGFLEKNLSLLRELLKVQSKQRRSDLIVSERKQVQFYLEKLPIDVVNIATFKKWVNSASGDVLKGLLMTKKDLLQTSENIENDSFPTSFQQGDLTWRLRYRFAPGDKADGVSVLVKRERLPELSLDAITWLVPGRLTEKCVELIKGLPKTYRRKLVPVPDRAAEISEHLLKSANYRKGNLLHVLSETVENFYRVDVPIEAWKESLVSNHLRMNVQLLDRRNRVIDQDRDLVALKKRNSIQLTEVLDQFQSTEKEDRKFTTFPRDGLSKSKHLKGPQGDFRVFPAFTDETEHVAVEMCATLEEQASKHEKGLSRLFLLAERQSVRFLKKEFQQENTLHLRFSRVGTSAEILDSILLATARQVYLKDGHEIWNLAEFEKLRDSNRGRLVEVGLDAIAMCRHIGDQRFKASLAIENIRSSAFENARADLEQRLVRLVPVDFMWTTPFDRIKDLGRYLEAMHYRAGNLQGKIEKDTALMSVANEWEQRLDNLVNVVGPKPEFVETKYLLEEHRVALFHQKLGTKEKVSQKRLTEVFENLERRYATTH